MRFNKIAFAIVMGICTTAQAEDNVFVDLSVLDNLNGSYMSQSEPLFPVLPKKEKTVQPKAKKTAKAKTKARSHKSVKKTAPVRPVVKTVVAEKPVVSVEAEPEVVVVDVEPATPVIASTPAVSDINKIEMPVKEAEKTVANDIADKAKAETEPEIAPNTTPAEDNVLINDSPAEIENAPIVPEEKKSELLIDEEVVAPAVM